MGAYGPSSVSPHKNVLLPVEAWDDETAYTELSVVFHDGSLWVAAEDNEDSEPASGNADWTLAVGGMPSANMAGLPWDASTGYVTGDTVIDRGGTWQATGSSTNSEPISGNTDWTLVAGTPYVDVLLDPVTLTTAPFLDPGSSGPGLTVVPGTLGSHVVLMDLWMMSSPGVEWLEDLNVNEDIVFGYDGQDWATAVSADNVMSTGLASSENYPYQTRQVVTDFVTSTANSPGNAGRSLTMSCIHDITGAGPAGTKSLLVRVFYNLQPESSFVSFFLITAVNTSAKRFFVSGDATSDLGTTFDITGSTANDGTYTKSSATAFSLVTYAITGAVAATKTITIAGNHAADFPVGSPAVIDSSADNDGTYTVVSSTFTVATAIVVAEVVPQNSAASGNIGHASETRVVVTETVASSTADGWVEAT